MLFDPKDLDPSYTAEEIEKLFFLRKDLSDLSATEKEALLAKVNSLGLKDIRLDTVQMLLCVMHEARELDQARFLKEIFLPWHAMRRKTQPHFKRISEELIRIGEFDPGSIEEAIHAANVYRSIVSDLFDPYLTLIVACFQFKSGTFTTLENADLGQGERNKYEFLTARFKSLYTAEPNFLSGYDPLVRNAISHSGAQGITYRSDSVVFKNIKRGTPVVVDTVVWTFDELQYRVIQLIECIQSIEVVAEIFGLDCAESFTADFDTYCHFVLHAVSSEQRSDLHKRHELVLTALRSAKDVSLEAKREALSQALFANCGIRNMACRAVRFSNDGTGVMVEVPTAAIDTSNDDQLIGLVRELTRYAILARSVFNDMYDEVQVTETDEARKKVQVSGKFNGKDLDEYLAERAGLVDLLNDSQWTLAGAPLGVEVDFDALDKAEAASAKEPFPRKARP